MANRVVFGKKGTDIGLYISKPGFNVLTTADTNLLFQSEDRALQVIQRGTIALTQGPTGVAIATPNVGYNPVVLLSPNFTSGSIGSTWDIVYTFEYVSLTSIRLRVALNNVFGYDGTTSYLVLNKPVTN